MRVVITGANGFLGARLAAKLVARGDEVVAYVRAKADLSRLDGLRYERREGELFDREALRSACDGAQVVFHLAGLRRSPERIPFFRVNAEGTRAVCEVLASSSAPPRLVHCSSLAAVGPRSDGPDETAPLQPYDWYGQSKAESERIVLGYQGRIPFAIARPTRILGPGDRENLILFTLVARGLGIRLGGAPRPISTIDVDDAADGMLLLADHPAALGEAFFINRDTTSFEALQEAVAQGCGTRPRKIPVAPALLNGIAAACDLVSKATGRPLPLNRKLARQLLVPGWTCSTRKAETRLGFRPTVTVEESMRAAAAWYRARGWL